MIIDVEKSIKDYYRKVKDMYPEVSYEQFKKSCKYPFIHASRSMRKNSLPDIRFKYIGVLRVGKPKLIYGFKAWYRRLCAGFIDKDGYQEEIKKLEKKFGGKYELPKTVIEEGEIIKKKQEQNK